MSLGRTVPFTPLSGKYGYVRINGVLLNVATWTPTQNTNALTVTNFNSPQDGNGNPHAEVIPAVITSTFKITGVFDASAQGFYPTAGDVGTGVLGYDDDNFFDIQFLVTSNGGAVNIEDKSGVEFDIHANGLAVMTGSNGGANG